MPRTAILLLATFVTFVTALLLAPACSSPSGRQLRDGAAGAETGADGPRSDAGPDQTPAACSPNQTRPCPCSSGTGSERCSPAGGAWGACVCSTYGAELSVSPQGSDTNPGSLDKPFGSIETARAAVRKLQAAGLPAGGVVVWLRGGVYERTSTLQFTKEDSGTPASPVVYRGYPGETVRLLGGKRISNGALKPVLASSPIWPKLDATARGQVMEIDLKQLGVTDFGQLKPRGMGPSADSAALEVFWGGQRLPLARWPDTDQNDPVPSGTEDQLTLYGTGVQPDVTGLYLKTSVQDSVSAFSRQGLVNGKQYHLYRARGTNAGSPWVAWFVTTTASGYPSGSDPFWHHYSESLGTFDVANGAVGSLTSLPPGLITQGFAHVATKVSGTAFTIASDRLSRWTGENEIWLHGFFRYTWADWHVHVAKLDASSRTLTLEAAPPFGLEPAESGGPFYAYNLPQELTRAGEWFLDRVSGILYLWPPAAPGSADLVVSVLAAPIVELQGTSHFRLEDVTLEASRKILVKLAGTTSARLVGCTLRDAGTDAAVVDGSSSGLDHCHVHGTGDRGVSLAGGDRPSLTQGGNFVESSHLHDFAQWCYTYRPAVSVAGAGQVVRHNLMHDSRHSAILFGGNEHRIELNEIHRVCSYSSDAGAVYGGRDWGARGNLIQHNFIHDIVSSLEGFGVHGVYLDDCLSGIRVHGNVLYKISGNAIQHGGGRDNLMTNNVIARCGTGLAADSRGATWTAINDTPGDSWNLLKKLLAVGYRKEPWLSAYPACAAIPDNYAAIKAPGALWLWPQGCEFSRNLGFANGKWLAESPPGKTFEKYAAMKDNVADADPRFVDEAKLNLQLGPGSPADSIPGFEPIPFASIGIAP